MCGRIPGHSWAQYCSVFVVSDIQIAYLSSLYSSILCMSVCRVYTICFFSPFLCSPIVQKRKFCYVSEASRRNSTCTRFLYYVFKKSTYSRAATKRNILYYIFIYGFFFRILFYFIYWCCCFIICCDMCLCHSYRERTLCLCYIAWCFGVFFYS